MCGVAAGEPFIKVRQDTVNGRLTVKPKDQGGPAFFPDYRHSDI
jgi:hypothetical protein